MKLFIHIFVLTILFVPAIVFPDTVADNPEKLNPAATPQEQIDLYNKTGRAFYQKGKYADALINFSRALTLAESINDSAFMAKLNSNIGVINDLIGNYSIALSRYQQSLLIYEKLNNQKGKESVLNNLGIIYEEMNMPDKALEYYLKALELKEERNDKKSIAGTYNNIAIIYRKFLNNMDSAYYYYDKALKYYIEAGDKNGEAVVYSNLGLIHLQNNEFEQADRYFNRSLDIFKKYDDKEHIANDLFYLGQVSFAKNNFKNALEKYLSSYQIAEKLKIKKLQANLLKEISKTYVRLGNYKLALKYDQKYDHARDELLNSAKLQQISKLETNYEIRKREQEIKLLKNQQELNGIKLSRTRMVFYAVVLILVLIIIIGVLNRHKNRIKRNQEMLVLQTRLFRSQTSPHFVFNSLMSIQAFLIKNQTKEASEYLVDFAKLIRSILEFTRESLITLDKEIEVLKQYVKLEKLRFSNKFDYEFVINVKNPGDIYFPPMLAQPFIENAIIHGLAPSPDKGLLRINFEEKNNVLTLTIEDNGIGREKSALLNKDNEHKPLATKITEERLKLIAKRHKRKITMQIEDLYDKDNNPAGTRVIFKKILN